MPQLTKLDVTADESGRRLDFFLASRIGWLSRMRIGRLVATGACRVNGSIAVSGQKVSEGDSIELDVLDAAPTSMTPQPLPLEVLHEDEHIIVVAKPSGMLVHPTRGVKLGTLSNALAYHLNRDRYGLDFEPHAQSGRTTDSPDQDRRESCGAAAGKEAPSDGRGTVVRPGIVHRLDKATSGIMVIAKTAQSLSVLTRHFRRRLIAKRYLALVHGTPIEDSFVISAPIERDPDATPHWRVTDTGKPSETRLVVLEKRAGLALVELEPVTGRTNQLRIHTAWKGHPIIGDDLYGEIPNPPDCRVFEEDKPPARLFLHAWRLAFHHPQNGAWMEFTSPLPDELSQYLQRIGFGSPRAGTLGGSRHY